MGDWLGWDDARNMLAWVLLALGLAVPVAIVAICGWLYGKSAYASPLGFLVCTVVAVICGSWTLGVAVGHGVGFGPLPSLLCGYFDIDAPAFSCVPPFWVTPVAALCAFAGSAIVAEVIARRRRARSSAD